MYKHYNKQNNNRQDINDNILLVVYRIVSNETVDQTRVYDI